MDVELEKKKMEKYMGPAVASDQYYLGDLSDDGIDNAYKLLHSEAHKNMLRDSDPMVADLLKAEICFRREYDLRTLPLPDMPSDDPINNVLGKLVSAGSLEKKDDSTTYAGETAEDTDDKHVHTFTGLDLNGDGETDEAGSPPHSHNISKFECLPIETTEGYKSDHPGKVVIKTNKCFKITKRLEDHFEWEIETPLIKADLEKRLVAGIVYEPDLVDAQNDSASSDEIEKACHNYMIRSMKVGKMHDKMLTKDEVAIVENYIAPTNFFIGTEFVRKGSWVQVHKVFSDELWKDIKEDKITGLSMAGTAKDIAPRKAMEKSEKGENTVPLLTDVRGGKLGGLVSLMKMDLEKKIRKHEGLFYVFAGERKLSKGYAEREDALKFLVAMEANKHLTARHLSAEIAKGGPGSGNFGHAGRQGERGGSSSDGGSGAPDAKKIKAYHNDLKSALKKKGYKLGSYATEDAADLGGSGEVHHVASVSFKFIDGSDQAAQHNEIEQIHEKIAAKHGFRADYQTLGEEYGRNGNIAYGALSILGGKKGKKK